MAVAEPHRHRTDPYALSEIAVTARRNPLWHHACMDMTHSDAGFSLVSHYQPAGDQPQAIEKLVAGF